MEYKIKDLIEIKESIKKLSDLSENEKKSLVESIEMLWLNSGVQKKKTDVKIPNNSQENISRIRQLLAAAWSEDFKD